MFAASKTDSASTGDYQISRSLRFNSADSAYLNRTFTTPTSNTSWSFSFWLKRSTLATQQYFLNVNSYCGIGTNSDSIVFWNNAGTTLATSTAVFRDVSAWYHVVVVSNGTTITAYVNNSSVLSYTGTITNLNSAVVHNIGRDQTSNSAYLNGYMTEINFIDGQALTPSSFGETDTQTGVWQPKAYSGSYGTNGFYLNFSDNSNTTAATLGKDYSGNGNNWTPNNFSVTAGAGNDSMVDSPTQYGFDTGVGGTVRGNYATFNPLIKVVSQPTLSNGNLLSTAPAGWSSAVGTIGVTSGKWYWEIVNGNSDAFVGICGDNATLGTDAPQSSTGTILYYGNTGNKRIDTVDTAYGSAFSTQTIGVALDIDGGTIVFYRDNVSQGSISLSSSTLNGRTIFPLSGVISTTATVNFGQRPFTYTAPSGFKALCTQNLPTPTIGATTATQAGKFFNAVTYTGTGSSLGVTGVGFQPDWVWVKSRSAATDHGLYDAVRGVQKQLESNGTGAETTETTGITAFGSDGFTTGALAQLNTSSATYVAWNWKANGSGSSNTAGSITSTVSASTTSGFSVVTYTGTGANATVGHGLGVAPAMVIYKNRTSSSTWIVYHTSISPTNLLTFTSGAQQNLPAYFNSLAATSSVLNIGSNSDMNASGANQLAYCFAPIAGYSAFGSYTGNGSTDGPFVFTGMRPAYLMIKRSSAIEGWYIYDVARGTYNVIGPYLLTESSAAEASGTIVDFLSNGFKIRESGNGNNASGSTYIYMAFASNPFKYSLAR
jgi:hypothetical protein